MVNNATLSSASFSAGSTSSSFPLNELFMTLFDLRTTGTACWESQCRDPVACSVFLCFSFIVATFSMGVVTGYVSWVDKIWSLTPIVYAWFFAWASASAGAPMAPRAVVLATCITVWGLRLTYNFHRKGGYNMDGEDYRWAIVKKDIPNWAWHLFHFFFICAFQNTLLLMLTFPVFTVATVDLGWNWVDSLLCVALWLLLAGETVADQQQWNFHQLKADRSLPRTAAQQADVKAGFLRSGLFAWSRHPNFLCEQLFWWTVCGFSINAVGWQRTSVWPPPAAAIGVIVLTLLFHFSTQLTEKISAKKYPAYTKYQRAVRKFF